MKNYGYKGNFDFSDERAVYLQDPLLLGTDAYADADNLYLDLCGKPYILCWVP